MYIENFKNNETISAEFRTPEGALDGANVLLAWYGYGSYCGDAFVLFEKTGKLYEVDGSHCSCFGLEGQWSPEETSWEALAKRNFYGSGSDGYEQFQVELKKLIENAGSDSK